MKLPILISCLFTLSIFPYIFIFGKNASLTLAEQNLLRIINAQKELFSQNPTIDNDNEHLTRKAQDLVAMYEAYISENSNDTHALLLYGKFLRKVGQNEHALSYFLRADSINPKLAVVKQQIANYLVEKQRPVDALPFFIAAVDIDPSVPEYHFHLGNFLHIFKDKIIDAELLSLDSLEKFSNNCFEKAAQTKPESFDYRLRYAQSFFDCKHMDQKKALRVWESIEVDFRELSKIERDYLNLCKARLLWELNEEKKAKSLIENVSANSLQGAKAELQNVFNKKKDKDKLNEKDSKKTGYFLNLQIDPRVSALQRITAALKEEKLIQDLKIDSIHAHQNKKGEIRLTVTEIKE